MLIVVSGVVWSFFFQAEDGIRGAQESRGLGDVYKRKITYPVRSLPSGRPVQVIRRFSLWRAAMLRESLARSRLVERRDLLRDIEST